MSVPITPAAVDVVWEPCGSCWGQRVIWRQEAAGLRREACPSCIGLGQRAVAVPRPGTAET